MRLYNKAYGEKNSEKLRSEAMDRYWLNRDSILEKNSARRAENLSAYRKRESEKENTLERIAAKGVLIMLSGVSAIWISAEPMDRIIELEKRTQMVDAAQQNSRK